MGYLLTDEAAHILDGARNRARKLDHASIDVHHLLAEIAESPEGKRQLVKRGVDPQLLAGAIEVKLAGSASRGGKTCYRVVADPELSREAQEAIASVAAPRWFRRIPADLPRLLDSLLASPTAIPLLADAEFDVSPIEKLEQAAVEVARSHRHTNVLVLHALCAMLDDAAIAPRFVQAVRITRLDPGVLRASLAALASPDFRSLLLPPIGTLVTWARAPIAGTTNPKLSPLPIVVRWLRSEKMRKVFDPVGILPFEVLFALAHGAPFEETFEGDALKDRLEVTLHDDNYTTMEFVVETLTTCFELDDERAQRLMRRVHEQKAATIGTYSPSEARDRVAQARALARSKLMPLRITTLPVLDVETPPGG